MSKLIQDKAALGKLIDSIKKAGAKLDADIQSAGLGSLHQLSAHGDIGYCNRLYNALSKGARKAAMTSWLLAYGSLTANTDSATKVEKPFVYTKDKATNVDGATADPWYDHKADPAPAEVFDMQKAIEGIIKKAKGKTLAHGELLTGLQALVAMSVSVDAHNPLAVTAGAEEGTEALSTEATEG